MRFTNLLNYHLIDDVTLVFFVCLGDDLIFFFFLLQQFEKGKLWTRTLINYLSLLYYKRTD